MKYFLAVLALVFAGCASTQLSNVASRTDQGNSNSEQQTEVTRANDIITLSYEIKQEYSTKFFGMVDFAIKNRTSHWLEVDSISISAITDSSSNTSADSDQGNIIITGGQDLDVWFKSMSEEKNVESINRQLFWGSLSLGAEIGSELSRQRQAKESARALSNMSGEMMMLERNNMINNQINIDNYFPEDHLLNVPFRIPPGLTADKWMVINSQVKASNEVVTGLKMKLFFQNGKTREYDIQLIKNLYSYTGVWQYYLIRSKYQPVNDSY